MLGHDDLAGWERLFHQLATRLPIRDINLNYKKSSRKNYTLIAKLIFQPILVGNTEELAKNYSIERALELYVHKYISRFQHNLEDACRYRHN
jgi:hypothetical protein